MNWSLELEGKVYSSPVIGDDGVMYIGTLVDPAFYAIYTGVEGIANSA